LAGFVKRLGDDNAHWVMWRDQGREGLWAYIAVGRAEREW
jgi:hypothetical protein